LRGGIMFWRWGCCGGRRWWIVGYGGNREQRDALDVFDIEEGVIFVIGDTGDGVATDGCEGGGKG
jgi:hypothetical protein